MINLAEQNGPTQGLVAMDFTDIQVTMELGSTKGMNSLDGYGISVHKVGTWYVGYQ